MHFNLGWIRWNFGFVHSAMVKIMFKSNEMGKFDQKMGLTDIPWLLQPDAMSL